MVPARTRALLVVDDDPAILDIAAVILGDAGYEVVAAATEDAALAALAARPFDLILADPLDVRSAGDPDRWDGLERLRVAGDGAPLVIFTAHVPGAFAAWAERGFMGLITKPFNVEGLAEAVGAALADGRANRRACGVAAPSPEAWRPTP